MIDPIKAIMALKDGQCWVWPESDYGRAEIWFKGGGYFLFEIPMYGGEPSFVEVYRGSELQNLITLVNSWT